MLNPEDISDEWLQSISSPAPAILAELEENTRKEFPTGAHMLTGFSQGRLLSLISNLIKPKRVLEIGTFTGYGSLCLAEGLSESGLVVTLENSVDHARFAEQHFDKSPFAGKIQVLTGKAMDSLNQLQETWDLAYLDADKSSNRAYLEKIWPSVRTGGLVLVDNVFSRGGIFKPYDDQRKFEKAVADLNHELPQLFPDASVIVLPIRDGLTILRKTS
jgi:predicted O-methyltransferase YrrM